MKVCIVIPMYNEEVIAQKNLCVIMEYTRNLPQQTTVLVVNDCSTDKTGEILELIRKSQLDNHLQIISHSKNLGYGGACRTGTQYAIQNRFDYVLFMDADFTNHPKYLIEFYKKMAAGFDYIKASRYVLGGKVEGVPRWRALISIIGNGIACWLYGLKIHDCTNGFRAGRVDIYKKMQLAENKFPVIMEELYQAKFIAKTFCEVPYILTARVKGRPTSFTYKPEVFFDYFKYALKSFFKIIPQYMKIKKD